MPGSIWLKNKTKGTQAPANDKLQITFKLAPVKTITFVLRTSPGGLQYDLVMVSLTGYCRNSSALE